MDNSAPTGAGNSTPGLPGAKLVVAVLNVVKAMIELLRTVLAP